MNNSISLEFINIILNNFSFILLTLFAGKVLLTGIVNTNDYPFSKKIFFSLLSGVFGICAIVALLATKGKTILIILPVLYAIYFAKNKKHITANFKNLFQFK